jgi:hypothetical protein
VCCLVAIGLGWLLLAIGGGCERSSGLLLVVEAGWADILSRLARGEFCEMRQWAGHRGGCHWAVAMRWYRMAVGAMLELGMV